MYTCTYILPQDLCSSQLCGEPKFSTVHPRSPATKRHLHDRVGQLHSMPPGIMDDPFDANLISISYTCVISCVMNSATFAFHLRLHNLAR